MRVIAGLAALVVLLAAGGAGWLLSLPPRAEPVAPAAVGDAEHRATLAALRPPKRARPVVAVTGINDATEVTDYLVPTGILIRAGVAEVVAVATEPGPVRLYPALAVEPDMTTAAFDAAYPEGADYVIVPAMSRDDDPAALAWIRQQAATGAIVVGVCAGAKVVAAAGLLEGRRATTHWYYRRGLERIEPSLVRTPDRRFVVEGRRGGATRTTDVRYDNFASGRNMAQTVADGRSSATDRGEGSRIVNMACRAGAPWLRTRCAARRREQGCNRLPGIRRSRNRGGRDRAGLGLNRHGRGFDREAEHRRRRLGCPARRDC